MSENIVESCEGSIGIYQDRMKVIEKWVKTIDFEDNTLYLTKMGSLLGIYGYSSDVTHSVFMTLLATEGYGNIEYAISKHDLLDVMKIKDYHYTMKIKKDGVFIKGKEVGIPIIIEGRAKNIYNVISEEISKLRNCKYKTFIDMELLNNIAKFLDKLGISTMYLEFTDSGKLLFKGDAYQIDVCIEFEPIVTEWKTPNTFIVDPKYILNIVSKDNPELIITENEHLINFVCNKKLDLFTLATKSISD